MKDGAKLLALLCCIGGTGVGCASAALPPRLSSHEQELVASAHFPATVAVEEYKFPAYSQSLIQSLRGTGLFDSVEHLGEFPDPDLIASVDRPISGTAGIPLLTIVSLGLIPTSVQEEWGEVFSLRAPDSGSPEVKMDFSYKGASTLGWFAGLQAAVSPQYSLARPDRTGRFFQALALSIVQRADEIERLLDQ